MKRVINKAAIEKVNYDSTYINVLSYHVVPLKEEGVYTGSIIHKDYIVDDVKINVSKEFKSTQANIDFSGFVHAGNKKTCKQSFDLTVNSYIVLYNSNNDMQLSFTLEKADKLPGKSHVYDTRSLHKGDLFSCVLLRPGIYEIGFKNKEIGMIKVEYPTDKTSRSELNNPMRVKVHSKGLNPKEIRVLPMQGIVFEFEESGSVQVTMKEQEKPRNLIYGEAQKLREIHKKKAINKKYQWRNPSYSQSKE